MTRRHIRRIPHAKRHRYRAPETALEFEWNGSYDRDLDEAIVTFENGWYRTTLVIPAAEVDYSPLSQSVNRFEFALDVVGGRIADAFGLTIDP